MYEIIRAWIVEEIVILLWIVGIAILGGLTFFFDWLASKGKKPPYVTYETKKGPKP